MCVGKGLKVFGIPKVKMIMGMQHTVVANETERIITQKAAIAL